MHTRTRWRCGLTALALAGACAAASAPALDASPSQHPFLLWTKEEAAAIRQQIETQPWAKAQCQALYKEGVDPSQRRTVENLFRYLVLGDKSVVDLEKAKLRSFVNCPPYLQDDFDWMWHRVDHYQHALRFDVLYDELTPGERRAVQETLRRMAMHGIEAERIRGLEGHPRMASHLVCAVASGDKRLIEAIFKTGGGFKQFIDSMTDGCFRPATADPLQRNAGHILLWCRGCERLGLNEFGFGYTGPHGASARRWMEGVLLAADPRIVLPGGRPCYGRAAIRHSSSFGHDLLNSVLGGSEVFAAPIVPGHVKDGRGGWPMFWTHAPAGEPGETRFETGEARMLPNTLLEFAHKQWPDAGFDFFLVQMRGLRDDMYYPSLFWGLDPLDPAKVKTPSLASGVYPETGLALLRAEEGPGYWESPAPMAAFRMATGYGRREFFSLTSFFALNRPLYLTLGWGRRGLPWMSNALEVDGLPLGKDVKGNAFVRWPSPMGQVPVRSALDPLVKFVCARGKPRQVEEQDAEGKPVTRTLEIYPGVDVERAFFLTREYLVDVLSASSGKTHDYRWVIHALGKAQPDQPAEWKESSDLVRSWPPATADDYDTNHYQLGSEYSRQFGKESWTVAAVQSRAAYASMLNPFQETWFERNSGVRMTMLGEAATTAYVARPEMTKQVQVRNPKAPKREPKAEVSDTGFTEVPVAPPKDTQTAEPQEPEFLSVNEVKPVHPDMSVFSIVAARHAARTQFIALHEPFESGAWKVEALRRIQQNEQGVALAVAGKEGSGLNDRVLLRLGDEPGQPLTLGDGEESFTFSDHAFVRIGAEKVQVSGALRAMKLKVAGTPKLVLNGKEEAAAVENGFLRFGK